MKNIINKIVFGSFLSLALVACEDKFEYTPAPQEATGTYVKADDTAARSLDIDGTDILVPFVRSTGEGTTDVTVALSDTSGIFTLKNTTVSFAAGETTAYATVSYSYDSLDPAAQYGFSVTITDGPVSEYAPVAFPMTCKKAWKKLGKGQFLDYFFIASLSEKEFIQSPDGSPTYRMLNPFTKAEIEGAGCTFDKEIPYIEFTIAEDGSVFWGNNFYTGFGYSGYSIYYANPDWYNGNAAAAAQNAVLMDNFVQICYTAMAVTGGSIAGSFGTGYAFMSLPGGPDIAEVLGL